MIGSILDKLFGRQYTLGELMNIDEDRQRKSYDYSVKLVKTYHQVKPESLLSKFKSFFLGNNTALMYYVIFKLSVTSNSSGKSYEVIIRTDPDYDLNNWMNNRVKIYCSCPDFKYRSAYVLEKRNSLFTNDRIKTALGSAMVDAPKGKHRTSLLCKHAFAALSWLLDNYQTVMKTI